MLWCAFDVRHSHTLFSSFVSYSFYHPCIFWPVAFFLHFACLGEPRPASGNQRKARRLGSRTASGSILLRSSHEDRRIWGGTTHQHDPYRCEQHNCNPPDPPNSPNGGTHAGTTSNKKIKRNWKRKKGNWYDQKTAGCKKDM